MSLNLVSPFTIFSILLGFGFWVRLWVVFGVHVALVVIEGCVVGVVNVVVWIIKAIVRVAVVLVAVDGVQVVVDGFDVVLRVQLGINCCFWVTHIFKLCLWYKKGQIKEPSDKIKFCTHFMTTCVDLPFSSSLPLTLEVISLCLVSLPKKVLPNTTDQ